MKEGAVAAFVELHIEQGPLLEKEGTQLGVVTAIAAPAALRVFFSGDGGHAGALLMPYRCDPLYISGFCSRVSCWLHSCPTGETPSFPLRVSCWPCSCPTGVTPSFPLGFHIGHAHALPV